MTLLLWAVCSTLQTVSTQLHDTLHNCCGQSAVHYKLSAHNCTAHYRTAVDSLQYATNCQHTTARHNTEQLLAFCSTLRTVSTQLQDTLQNCCGQSAVSYTLSAQNCTAHYRTAVGSLQYATHCQHTTARHITELLWQSIRCSPSHSRCQKAVHNISRPQTVPFLTSPLQSDPT